MSEKKKSLTDTKINDSGIKGFTERADNILPIKRRTGHSIAGHNLTKREVDIFIFFHTCHDAALTCQHFGISRSTLYRLRMMDWWKSWEIDELLTRQAEFEHNLFSKNQKLMKAVDRLIEGHPNDTFPAGWANAIKGLVEVYAKSSPKNIRATLVPRADAAVEKKEDKELHNYNEDLADKIKKLLETQDGASKLADWVRSGDIPAEILLEVKKETSIQNHRITFRMTEREAKFLHELATNDAVSVNTVIRFLIKKTMYEYD